MSEEDMLICDDMLRYGDIVSDNEYIIDGACYRQYVINVEGMMGRIYSYHLTKKNGRWIYIHCEGIVN